MDTTVPQVINAGVFSDDRGAMAFYNDLNIYEQGIKRFYTVGTHKAGFIRAFHGHEKEGKLILPIRGTVTIVTVHMATEELRRYTLSSSVPMILRIPPSYFHGIQFVQQDSQIMVFSTATLEESKADDIRKVWNAFGEDVWKDVYR